MGTAVWQPKWWTTDQHESGWERVKEALKRDWEQTKVDLAGHGKDLDQDIDDTVKQAVGKDVIPPAGMANAPGGTPARTDAKWDEVEEPFKYGVGARHFYGKDHEKWNDNLEGKLKSEWEEAKDSGHGAWNDVKSYVRRGYERATS